MPNFHNYLMRHGEDWILKIIEQIERNEGIRTDDHIPLEDRWNALMQSPLPQKQCQQQRMDAREGRIPCT
jgi:hypothetical protein